MEHKDELLQKLVLEIHRDMGVVISQMAAIKEDVKEHMRRTAILETEVKYLHAVASKGKVIGAILGILFAAAITVLTRKL